MAFYFVPPVDPENPLDPDDPPPDGWDAVDLKVYNKVLFGSPSPIFTACRGWEQRERERLEKLG